jgi:hypothetical protein
VAEQEGRDLLERLLKLLEGVDLPVDAGPESALRADVDCQIPDCSSPAIFRCSSGFRYCAKHVHNHGAWGHPHDFGPMATRRTDVEAGKKTLRGRLDSGELEPPD